MSLHLRNGPSRKPAWLKGRKLKDLHEVRLVRAVDRNDGTKIAEGTVMLVSHTWRGYLMLCGSAGGLRHIPPSFVEPVSWHNEA